MDMTITVFLKKAVPKIWIIVLCALIGVGGAQYFLGAQVQTHYAEMTLISLDTDKSIWGIVSMDDMNMSRRVVTDYLQVAYSRRVSNAAAIELTKYGYNLTPDRIRSMVSIYGDATLIYLRVTSTDETVVVDTANEVGKAFVTTLESLTGQTYVSILDEADSTRVSSAGMSRMLYLTGGLLGGAVIGAVIVFLIIFLNKRIKMVEDVLGVKAVDNLVLIPHHSIKY